MAVRVKDKIKPITTFRFSFPIIFSVSGPEILEKQIKEIFGDNNNRVRGASRKLKKDFLKDYFNVKNESELLKKNKILHSKFVEFKEEFIDEAGLTHKEMPKWQREKLNSYIKEKKEKNEK